jgi:hypothetical protein
MTFETPPDGAPEPTSGPEEPGESPFQPFETEPLEEGLTEPGETRNE